MRTAAQCKMASMRVERLAFSPDQADPVLALALLDAVGQGNLAAAVLRALERPLPASHCTIFALQTNGRFAPIASASGIGELASIAAVEYIRRRFDTQDSNLLWLARRKPGRQRQFWLGHQFAADVPDEAYRRVCYIEPGIRERLSILAVQPTGERLAISIYRNHTHRDFSEADRSWLGRQAPVLATAALRHQALQGTPAVGTAEHDQRMATLSARERELLSHVLAGRTTKEAAARMGVSLTTAITYRGRAFQHLGVRSLRELVALGTRSG